MKKASLCLFALILFSSVSFSFGMEDGEGNNAPNTSSWGKLLKNGLKIAGVVFAIMVVQKGGLVVHDYVSQPRLATNQLPIEVECTLTDMGFRRCVGYINGDRENDIFQNLPPTPVKCSHTDSGSLQCHLYEGTLDGFFAEAKENREKLKSSKGKRGKHPKPRRN